MSLAPKLTVDEAQVDWTPAGVRDRPARPRLHPVRPAPGRPSTGSAVKLGPVDAAAGRDELGPGDLAVGKRAVLVGTGTHAVELGEVQPPGKPRMRAADWARGLHTAAASVLGT